MTIVIRNRLFAVCHIPGAGWIRVFGYGVSWKDTKRNRLFFSERNGHRRHWMLGRWSLSVLGGL